MHGKSRYLTPKVEEALSRKMVFVAGPRQCGKTTMAKEILRKHEKGGWPDRYLNWDDTDDRELLLQSRLPAKEGFLVLDEVHKFKRWRQLLKGHFDKHSPDLKILVTGSARLDHYRRGGDSLQGRYRFFRLHAFSYSEIAGRAGDQKVLEDLFRLNAFPEPFLSGSEKETKIWSRDYRSRLVREDLGDLERVQEVSLLEQMMVRLPQLVGSPLSVNALREDLQISHQTAARWLDILERLYAVFRVYPFGAPRIRAVKKEAKHYHFDWNLVADPGARFENLVACHLLKNCQYREDADGEEVELRYFRDTDQREVDFVVVKSGKPERLIECKLANTDVAPSLRYLSAKFPKARATQVVMKPNVYAITKEGIEVVSASRFLHEFV